MKAVSAIKMQRIDKTASRKYGIPALILMENAAIVSAGCVLQMLKPGQDKVTIFCGQGNNGGDGLGCARHLINRGLKVRVYFAGRLSRLSPEARLNYQILVKMGQRLRPINSSVLKKQLQDTDLIVDALLGIGLKGKVRPSYLKLFSLINNSEVRVLSLDVPSGLDATSGRVHGGVIKANKTVTFGLIKRGLLKPQASQYVGDIIIGDIGLPPKLLS